MASITKTEADARDEGHWQLVAQTNPRFYFPWRELTSSNTVRFTSDEFWSVYPRIPPNVMDSFLPAPTDLVHAFRRSCVSGDPQDSVVGVETKPSLYSIINRTKLVGDAAHKVAAPARRAIPPSMAESLHQTRRRAISGAPAFATDPVARAETRSRLLSALRQPAPARRKAAAAASATRRRQRARPSDAEIVHAQRMVALGTDACRRASSLLCRVASVAEAALVGAGHAPTALAALGERAWANIEHQLMHDAVMLVLKPTPAATEEGRHAQQVARAAARAAMPAAECRQVLSIMHAFVAAGTDRAGRRDSWSSLTLAPLLVQAKTLLKQIEDIVNES